MKKITCDYCFEDNYFDQDAARPESCRNCNSPLGHLEAIDPDAETGKKSVDENFTGVRLKYNKTGEVIELPHSEIQILGRQNAGSEVLGKIPQISREHCKIEFLDGKYKVTDLNSMNGTFLGPGKRDCLKKKYQELKDGDILYLGKEQFRVFVHLPQPDESTGDSGILEELESRRYKCKACGKIHDLNLAICDACGSYGQVEPLDP
jgi:hypothetical protein